MIHNYAVLMYINTVTGKPVICVYNDIEKVWYTYLADEFKPANPSNHVHDNYLCGREISGLLTSLSGFSHGFNTTSDTAVLTKIEELPIIKVDFNDFKWVKIRG